MNYIKISLLPSELKRESSMMRRWTLFALILSIVAVVAFLVSFMFNVYLRGPIDELDSLKEQNSLMTESINRLSYIQEMFDTIEQNNAIIEELRGEEVDWAFAFDLASNNATLYNITVRRIIINRKAVGVNSVMTAQCGTINEMTAWADSARNQEGIDSVELTGIQKLQTSDNQSAFYFEANIVISKWNAE